MTNFILQTTLFRHIEIFGVSPNTAVIIIVSFAVLRGELTGCIVGFAAGLLWDITTGGLPGYYALLGALTGWLSGLPFSGFYKENYVFPALLTFISLICWETVYFFSRLSGKVSASAYFAGVSAPVVVYTMVLSLPIFVFLYWVNKKVSKEKEKL